MAARTTPRRSSEALAGHVCRCTGYAKIIDAVAAAARGDSFDLTTTAVGKYDDAVTLEVRNEGRRRTDAPLRRRRARHGPHDVRRRRPRSRDAVGEGAALAGHHAGITRLDTSKAESMPGVHAVITWKDVPLLAYGHLSALGIPADEPLLAKEEVRYKGQPIALVAAEARPRCRAWRRSRSTSRSARALRHPPRVPTPMRPKIHQWGNWYPHFEGEMDRRQIRKGDIDRAFEQADTIVQGVTARPRSSTRRSRRRSRQVVPEPNGRLTIYSCSQALYFSLGVVAAHLRVPLNRLKIVGGTTGGGFGGKVDTATETMTCLLAMKSSRPVKWRWTREEEFLCSSTRAPWHMEIATAMTKDGWILGQKMLTLHDSGAYARSPYGLTKHSFHHTGAYSIPTSTSTATSSSRTACRRRRCAASA